jgi:adhesin transport system membrane fusion protein
MATLDAELDGGMQGPSLTIWLTAATLLIFLLWAAFAWIDEIVRAEGEIISSSRPQIIQNLEGGILAEMLVRQGDTVQPGDVLARLYGTPFQTAVDDLSEQITSLEIKRLRLEAEIGGEFDFTVPARLKSASPDIIASERALLSARQSDYVSRTDGAHKILVQTQRERDLLENLLDRDIVSLIEVTRARKSHGDAEIKYNEIVTRSELDRANEYSETLKELATLRQNLKVSQDQLDRSVIKSPMRGVVNSVSVTTIGGVVRPGEEIFQIIPLDEELFVEARVKPKDIANIKRGQQATVKLSAYDYTIYGSLKGSVKVISADTFKDERKPDGDAHYKVTLAVDISELTSRQANVEIRPGMQAQVELHTGEKTVLQYLTKPLYKSREAFHEP